MSDALDWVTGDVDVLRQAYAAERAALAPTCAPDVQVDALTIPGLNGLSFLPSKGAIGAPILYFHGGSWMLGSPETHRALCSWLCCLTGRQVMSVSYPLAPEHRYPAQRDAARQALAAVQAGVPESRIFVAGDSAGAAMALWAVGVREEAVLGVVAFYPAFGVTSSPSIARFGPASAALNQAAISAMYDRLGAHPEAVQNDVAQEGAPVLILAAGQDPLRDDAYRLEKHVAMRHPTRWHAEHEPHAFLHEAGTRAEVRGWLRRVGEWMMAQESAAGPKDLSKGL